LSVLNTVRGELGGVGIGPVVFVCSAPEHDHFDRIVGLVGVATSADVVVVGHVYEALTIDTDRAVVVRSYCEADLARSVSELAAAHPERPILVLERPSSEQVFLDCLMAGAVGFCDPEAGAEAIARTLDAIARQGVAVPRELVRVLVDAVRCGSRRMVELPAGSVSLTQREWEVLLLLRQQRSTADIAEQLFISKATVRSHVAALMHKLGAADRQELVSAN
jgi:DNA-binding NarL/FixJ family response regulator